MVTAGWSAQGNCWMLLAKEPKTQRLLEPGMAPELIPCVLPGVISVASSHRKCHCHYYYAQ